MPDYKYARIDRAFVRGMNEVRSTEGRFRVCLGEFNNILKAAKSNDGKISRSEAREIVHRTYWGYSQFTPAAERAAEAFAKRHGVPTNAQDFFGER